MGLDPPSAFKLYNKYKKPRVVKYKKGMRPHVPIPTKAKKKSPLMQSVEKFHQEDQVQALRDLAKKPFETIVLVPKSTPQVFDLAFVVPSSSDLGANVDATPPEGIPLQVFSSI